MRGDWRQYSEGGCSLIYDGDIAERLCNPSEYKRTKEGQNPPKAENACLNEEIEHLRARLEYKQGKLNKLKEENARLTRELAELKETRP